MKLLDVRPMPSTDNTIDAIIAHAEFTAQGRFTPPAFSMKMPDFQDLLLGQFGPPALFTTAYSLRVNPGGATVSFKRPSPRNHVTHVFSMVSNTKMVGRNATWRVARMQNKPAWRYRAFPMGEQETVAMGTHGTSASRSEYSVAFRDGAACPKPTSVETVALADPSPKPHRLIRLPGLVIAVLRAIVATTAKHFGAFGKKLNAAIEALPQNTRRLRGHRNLQRFGDWPRLLRAVRGFLVPSVIVPKSAYLMKASKEHSCEQKPMSMKFAQRLARS